MHACTYKHTHTHTPLRSSNKELIILHLRKLNIQLWKLYSYGYLISLCAILHTLVLKLGDKMYMH